VTGDLPFTNSSRWEIDGGLEPSVFKPLQIWEMPNALPIITFNFSARINHGSSAHSPNIFDAGGVARRVKIKKWL